MKKDMREKNIREPAKKEQIHPRLAQMNRRLAVINSQITKHPAPVSTNPLNILVICSDRELLANIRSLLTLHQMKVMTVVDGLTALTLFDNHRFDMVVTAISTTRLSGNIIAQYINNGKTPTPVIAITDSPAIEPQHFDAALQIPLQLDVLLKEIKRHTSVCPPLAKMQ